MKSRISILGMILMLSMFLTGCYGALVNTTINEDGSGTISSKVGFSEAAYKMMKDMEAQNGAQGSMQLDELKPFNHNGKIYYGESLTENFGSVEEFQSKMLEHKDSEEVDSGDIKIIKNSDGTFSLTLTITAETANVTETKNSMTSFDLTQAQIDSLMKDMVMVYTFFMPGKLIQTEGDSAGITINNNVLKIDYFKLALPTGANTTKKYSFITNKAVVNSTRFTDVPTTLWSYKAIDVLADGGLVSGVGEGRFSPERGMKISEFCQVLSNATGLESGADETGYWAAKAIKSCIEKGYIYTHGDINIQNYDAVITREEAIAAMQLASSRPQIAGKNITIDDIPDGAQISDKYKSLILQAYNSGITTGVNDQLKFSPKNQLTRGQVCQLFYNVNWTNPIAR